jgi:Tol biopolymer transport system component/DNA-binding winged helix-turn-helix (wHTH) protein
MSDELRCFYDFERFRLDPVRRRLLRDGEPVRLTPKAFDTLLILVESSGRTIEKDDLMERVWPDAVVEENNLNQNISALRRVLGDSRDESRYIATIPGFGYRFVAEVKRVVPEEEQAVREPRKLRLVVGNPIELGEDAEGEKPGSIAISAEPGASVMAAAPERDFSERIETLSPAHHTGEIIIAAAKRHKKVSALILSLIFVGAAAIAFWVYKLVISNRIKTAATETTAKEIEVTVLTRTGTIGIGTISRDGQYIVYSVREAGLESLWLRQVAAPSALQVIPSADVSYQGLTFSLDSNHVYVVRREIKGPGQALYRVAALGSVPIKLLADVHSPISLSPDGTRLAFVRESKDESALIIANVDGSNQRKLAARPMSDQFKVPAWSPDGKEIACSAGSGDPYDIRNSVVAVRVQDGSQRPLTPQKWAWTRWVEWLANGSGFLLTGRDSHETQNQIWHISYPGGVARRLTDDSKPYYSISMTADSRTLLAVQSQLLSDIWVLPDLKSDKARKATFGIGAYGSARYAPDGRIVYSSSASGSSGIWIMNTDGGDQKQLTSDASVNEDPVVSPDGKYIVFGSNRAGVINIWRMNRDGSNPLQLTRGGGEKFPQCSPDGRWVVYNSVAHERDFYALWKVPIEGGEPTRLTDTNTYYPAISPDNTRLAYIYPGESSDRRYRIAVIPFEGGQPEKTFDVAPGLDFIPYVRWSSDGQSLTYAAARDGFHNIWAQPLGGGPARQLTDLKIEGRIFFDWSRDGKHLVFVRRLWTNDLVLLRNFGSLGIAGKNSQVLCSHCAKAS